MIQLIIVTDGFSHFEEAIKEYIKRLNKLKIIKLVFNPELPPTWDNLSDPDKLNMFHKLFLMLNETFLQKYGEELDEWYRYYRDEETKNAGNQLIDNELNNISDQNRREKTVEYLRRIEHGERDLYF